MRSGRWLLNQPRRPLSQSMFRLFFIDAASLLLATLSLPSSSSSFYSISSLGVWGVRRHSGSLSLSGSLSSRLCRLTPKHIPFHTMISFNGGAVDECGGPDSRRRDHGDQDDQVASSVEQSVCSRSEAESWSGYRSYWVWSWRLLV